MTRTSRGLLAAVAPAVVECDVHAVGTDLSGTFRPVTEDDLLAGRHQVPPRTDEREHEDDTRPCNTGTTRHICLTGLHTTTCSLTSGTLAASFTKSMLGCLGTAVAARAAPAHAAETVKGFHKNRLRCLPRRSMVGLWIEAEVLTCG